MKYVLIIAMVIPICALTSDIVNESDISAKIIQFDSLTKISNVQENGEYFSFWVKRKSYPYFTAYVYKREGLELFNHTIKRGHIKNVRMVVDEGIFVIIVSGWEGGYGVLEAQDSIKAFNFHTGKLIWETSSAAHRYEFSPGNYYIVGTSPHPILRTQYDIIKLNNGSKSDIPKRPSLIKFKDDTTLIFIKTWSSISNQYPLAFSTYNLKAKRIISERTLEETRSIKLGVDYPGELHIDSLDNIFLLAKYRDHTNVVLKYDKNLSLVWSKELGYKRPYILSFLNCYYFLTHHIGDIKLINMESGQLENPFSILSSIKNMNKIDEYILRNWLSNQIVVPKRLKVDYLNSKITILEM